jgi:UDP-N-acetyl-D-glucosamine dehydrogenase
VGLRLAWEFASRGYEALGVDVDRKKVQAFNAGRSEIADIDDTLFSKVRKSGMLNAASNYRDDSSLDVIHICVPTPFTPHEGADISFTRTHLKITYGETQRVLIS